MNATPGSLVRYREREWVVLPSEDPDLVRLRPIGGSGREICGVVRSLSDLIGYSLPFERVEAAEFPAPDPTDVQDLAAVRLLQESARLLLREGAAPFRSLGHLSFRPRLYQFVPLMMALRLETVRLLIADDVGVGKTIEAGLIARELLDRGRVSRVCVLCPPYLCDQWQRELRDKFNIDAVVIRSSTLARLERDAPQDTSIFSHYRHFVASIDLVKGRTYRPHLEEHCPDLLLVDEAHGASQLPRTRGGSRQQRHSLLRTLARDHQRHVVLLTATPHSGIEESFLSILGLLRPEFGELDLSRLRDAEYRTLAGHFVQRRRQHVMRWMGEETPFPTRDDADYERPYDFSPEYRRLYESVYEFARGIVRSADTLSGWKRRMRYWSALALLRCISSSPAAAEVALGKRAGARGEDESTAATFEDATDEQIDDAFSPVVADPLDAEAPSDASPREVFEAQEQDPSWRHSERRRLQHFAREARRLQGAGDTKLQELVDVVASALRDGYQPIVWCRYIATADYVAEHLQLRLEDAFVGLRVTSVTGALQEEERRLKVEELADAPSHVLVATDCLSEGINLQEDFSAAIHYDLPWNPNRLEQREGRVDRFGQRKPVVRVAMLFGRDNPVDGAVLDVLVRKARDIRRQLGISVPVPIDSETVLETVMRSLFRQAQPHPTQLGLFEAPPDAEQSVAEMHAQWERSAERERETQARFAQQSVDEGELAGLLDRTDRVLGAPEDVRRFLQDASQRMGFGLRRGRGDDWELSLQGLPAAVRQRVIPFLPREVRRRLEKDEPATWRITFTSPTPEGLSYVGRNHPLIESLAEHLFDLAFHPVGQDDAVSRCGVIQTDAVNGWTTLWVLRLRYLQHAENGGVPQLAEETLVWGHHGLAPDLDPLSPEDAARLLDEAAPAANVSAAQKRETLTEALRTWPELTTHLDALLDRRAAELAESHRRLGAGDEGDVRIEPRRPPDLLGLVVLLPVPGSLRAGQGVRS